MSALCPSHWPPKPSGCARDDGVPEPGERRPDLLWESLKIAASGLGVRSKVRKYSHAMAVRFIAHHAAIGGGQPRSNSKPYSAIAPAYVPRRNPAKDEQLSKYN